MNYYDVRVEVTEVYLMTIATKGTAEEAEAIAQELVQAADYPTEDFVADDIVATATATDTVKAPLYFDDGEGDGEWSFDVKAVNAAIADAASRLSGELGSLSVGGNEADMGGAGGQQTAAPVDPEDGAA